MDQPRIATKLCNFLIPNAQVNLGIYSAAATALGVEPQAAAVRLVLEAFRRAMGGLWVGGTAVLTSHHLLFIPNAANRLVHDADYSVSIPLVEIVDLTSEPGFLTGIIQIATRRGVMKMRCFGSRAFLRAVNRQRLATSHTGR